MDVVGLSGVRPTQVAEHFDLRPAHCVSAECRTGEHDDRRLAVLECVRDGNLVQTFIATRSGGQFRDVIHVVEGSRNAQRRDLADVHRHGSFVDFGDDFNGCDASVWTGNAGLDSPGSDFVESQLGYVDTSCAVWERKVTSAGGFDWAFAVVERIFTVGIAVGRDLHDGKSDDARFVGQHHRESARSGA